VPTTDIPPNNFRGGYKNIFEKKFIQNKDHLMTCSEVLTAKSYIIGANFSPIFSTMGTLCYFVCLFTVKLRKSFEGKLILGKKLKAKKSCDTVSLT
jgi:hypothetical protein